MGRKKSFVKKDPFDGLPEGFKDAIEGSSTDDIRKRISDIALLDCEMKATLKADPDVQQARDVLKNLLDPYREDIKSYKLQIAFCKQVLDDKGGGKNLPTNLNATL